MKRGLYTLLVAISVASLVGCKSGTSGCGPGGCMIGSCASAPETCASTSGQCCEDPMVDPGDPRHVRDPGNGRLGRAFRRGTGDPGFVPGPASGAVTYPYYTTRGPRDFLNPNPPSIGP